MKTPHAVAAAVWAALIAVALVAAVHAAEPPAPESPMSRVRKLVSDLASASGFSDEDAVKVSVFFLEQLLGPKPGGQTLATRVSESTPDRVRVFTAYDFGIGFSGFEFEYRRGDPNKGMRWASFSKLEHIPSE
jgi:hypothetical protein